MTINLTLQSQVPVIILITLAITVFVFVAYRKLKAYDPMSEPKGIVLLCIMLVEWIDGMVKDTIAESYVKSYGPFIGSLAVYLLLANYVGLLGLDNPTLNFSCTLAITLVVWVIFQATDIKYMGLGGYIKSFFEPFALFFITNIFSLFSPLLSMSMRLFGNILSGSIIMQMFYAAMGMLSNKLLPFLGGIIDPLGAALGSVLHLYFDIFSGFIQMYVYIMLTMAFIGTRIPDDAKKIIKQEGE